MAIAGTLEIQMIANIARLQSDMTSAKGMVGNAMNGIESAVASAKSALGALGVGLSAFAFVHFIEGGIKAQASLKELSLQTGITVETLSALRPVAKEAGTSIENVAGMVNKLEKNMLTFAQSGTGKAAAAFKQLGFSQEDVRNGLKNIDAFLPEFAKRLMDAGVGGETAGLAMQLMAKGGAAALPFLERLVETGTLHARVTTDQANAAHEFEIQLVKMKESSNELAISLANELLPSLSKIVEKMLEARKNGAGFFGSLNAGIWAIEGEMAKVLPGIFESTKSQMTRQIAGLQSELNNLNSKANFTSAFDPFKNHEKIKAEAKSVSESLGKVQAEYDRLFRNAGRGVVNPEKVNPNKKNDLNYKGLGDPHLAAAELKLYEGAVKSLSDKLGALEHQTETQKLAFELYGRDVKVANGATVHLTGSLEKLTPKHKEMLPILAAEHDRRYTIGLILKSEIEYRKALDDVLLKGHAITTAAHLSARDQIDQYQFESSLIGKTSEQLVILNAKRQIELAYRQQLKSLGDLYGDDMVGLNAAIIVLDHITQSLRNGLIPAMEDRQKLELDWSKGATKGLNEYFDGTRKFASHVEELVTKSFKGMEDALTSFVMTGKLDFASLANSIIADMVRIMIQQSITGPLAKMALAWMGAPAANGAYFDGGVSKFASGGAFTNQIVDQPTPFRFASGGGFRNGVMGEAGPEAIMPLSRGSDGKLGVKASGESNVINITINAVVGDVASKSDVVAGMRATASQITSQLQRNMKYGGVMA